LLPEIPVFGKDGLTPLIAPGPFVWRKRPMLMIPDLPDRWSDRTIDLADAPTSVRQDKRPC
jgi:hypothetical protein